MDFAPPNPRYRCLHLALCAERADDKRRSHASIDARCPRRRRRYPRDRVGAGPPVLLPHGNPDSGIMWEGIAERLAPHCRCIAPDLPGFGHSEVPANFEPFARRLGAVRRTIPGRRRRSSGRSISWRTISAARSPSPGRSSIPTAVRRMVAINTLFFSDYRWHFWARVWRTPILGELSMLAMNRPMFAQELRRGSKGISDAHIDSTWALMTPRMKKEVLRLYRATNSANFQPWEDAFLELVRDQADARDLGRQGPLRLVALRRTLQRPKGSAPSASRPLGRGRSAGAMRRRHSAIFLRRRVRPRGGPRIHSTTCSRRSAR